MKDQRYGKQSTSKGKGPSNPKFDGTCHNFGNHGHKASDRWSTKGQGKRKDQKDNNSKDQKSESNQHLWTMLHKRKNPKPRQDHFSWERLVLYRKVESFKSLKNRHNIRLHHSIWTTYSRLRRSAIEVHR